jgi:hypothetical protein
VLSLDNLPIASISNYLANFIEVCDILNSPQSLHFVCVELILSLNVVILLALLIFNDIIEFIFGLGLSFSRRYACDGRHLGSLRGESTWI